MFRLRVRVFMGAHQGLRLRVTVHVDAHWVSNRPHTHAKIYKVVLSVPARLDAFVQGLMF